MVENRPAVDDASSVMEMVRPEGATRRAVLSRISAAVFLAACFTILILVLDMSPAWRLALMALAIIVAAAALMLDSTYSPAYRYDHLGFFVILSSQRGGKHPGREQNAKIRGRLAEAVKSHLGRNRISFHERKPFANGLRHMPEAGILYLENWTAELRVKLAEAGGLPAARITVGPVSGDNEPALRKMMADLKKELERELVSRGA